MYNVMIVEDDVMYRYAIRTSFEWEKEGFRICAEAINGKHALSMLNDCLPKIVITDINMPEMNGIDLIAALKQLDPNIHIIVLSAYDDFHFVKQALKSGAYDYLLKHDLNPLELARLMQEFKEAEESKSSSSTVLNHPELIIRGSHHSEIQQIINYVKMNYHKTISLQQLADVLFLSPNYLCNFFKQETGLTIFEYIKQVRIQKTKQLLDTTQLRVYQIAELVGFSNSSYLCRVFKEMTSISINEYRRNSYAD